MTEELQLPEILYMSHNGVIITGEDEIPISGISAHFSEDGLVIIEGTIPRNREIDGKFDIIFQDKNGWNISAKNFVIIKRNESIVAGVPPDQHSSTFESRGLRLIAERGEIKPTDNVDIYYVITDIDFASERRIEGFRERGIKFNINLLKNIMLIKSNNIQVPRSVGYFALSDVFSAINEKWRNIFDILLLILKFAASDFISHPVMYVTNHSGGERIEAASCMEYNGKGSNIFYLGYPGTISGLVESTFEQFASLRSNLDLDKLIAYYVMMKHSRFVDTKYLLGCIFMEGLKYSFSKNIKRITYDEQRHGFKKSDGSNYAFKELIDLLYREYNITNGSTTFIKYRNEVVHEGALSSISFEEIILKEQELETTIEHLLLNILKYDGLYWDRSSREWVEYNTIIT